jgi:hypothetical protein
LTTWLCLLSFELSGMESPQKLPEGLMTPAAIHSGGVVL